jgi:hypothetical protein
MEVFALTKAEVYVGEIVNRFPQSMSRKLAVDRTNAQV